MLRTKINKMLVKIEFGNYKSIENTILHTEMDSNGP